MNGRLEQEQKIFAKIENKVRHYPLFIQEWIFNLRASDCSAKTCRDYLNKITQYLSSIKTDISKIQLSDLNYSNTSRYIVSTKTKTVNGNICTTSDSFQQNVWGCLNNFFSFLVQHNYIDKNIMKTIKKPKNKDLVRINENRILLNINDFNDILMSVQNGVGTDKAKTLQSRMKNRDMAIMLIFMTTGIRKDALAQINVEDIDTHKKTLAVIDKGDIYHYYDLTDKTVTYISKWLEERINFTTSNALFVSYKGSRLSGNSIYKLVEKYCEDALGYAVSPHKLRSGFCSIMYKETGDVEKVRRMVGHANISTTQRYIVTKHEERKEAANIMGKLL